MPESNEFTEMHAAFARWCERQEEEGWESPEVKEAAQRLVRVLWMCANNSSLPPVIVTMLGDATAAFERAKGVRPVGDNGHQ
jgi:hypothetical protein